jgi:hypothetical protein
MSTESTHSIVWFFKNSEKAKEVLDNFLMFLKPLKKMVGLSDIKSIIKDDSYDPEYNYIIDLDKTISVEPRNYENTDYKFKFIIAFFMNRPFEDFSWRFNSDSLRDDVFEELCYKIKRD